MTIAMIAVCDIGNAYWFASEFGVDVRVALATVAREGPCGRGTALNTEKREQK